MKTIYNFLSESWLLAMELVLGMIVMFAIFTGCPQSKPATVVAPTGPQGQALSPAIEQQQAAAAASIEAKQSALSKVSAAAGVIQDVNQDQPPGPITEGVKNEAALQQTIAGPPRPEDEAEALKRKLIIKEGDLVKIAAAYKDAQTAAQAAQKALIDTQTALNTANARLDEIQAKWAAEVAENAVQLQKRIDAINAAADARVAKAIDDERKAFMTKINYVLLGLGGLLILAAVAFTFLTSGAQLGKTAILAGGAGLCFGIDYTLNQPWFKWIAIGCTVLTFLGAAVWVFLEWKSHAAEKARAAALEEANKVKEAAKKIVTVLDKTYENATEDAKKVLDPAFDQLSREMDKADKAVVHELRCEANTTPPPA